MRVYYIYSEYNNFLSKTTNINKLNGIEFRNDKGLSKAPPTKYKLLNGEIAKYKFMGSEILDMPAYKLKQLIPIKTHKNKKNANKKKQSIRNIIKANNRIIYKTIN